MEKVRGSMKGNKADIARLAESQFVAFNLFDIVRLTEHLRICRGYAWISARKRKRGKQFLSLSIELLSLENLKNNSNAYTIGNDST